MYMTNQAGIAFPLLGLLLIAWTASPPLPRATLKKMTASQRGILRAGDPGDHKWQHERDNHGGNPITAPVRPHKKSL